MGIIDKKEKSRDYMRCAVKKRFRNCCMHNSPLNSSWKI